MKTMRFIMALLLMCVTASVTAQTASELKIKASKDAKKAAKTLKKEGWTVMPGGLPLERQIDRSYVMRYDFGSDFQPKYAFGEARSIGQMYDAAKLQANELSKVDLVSNISIEITRLVEDQIKTKQLPEDQAQSAIGVVQKSKSLVVQKIGAVVPVVEIYRKLKNGNYEVQITIAYDKEKIFKSAKDEVNKQLKDEGIDIELMQ